MAAGSDVDELDRRVRELAAHIHAATCELAGLVTELQRTADWSDSVVRSFPHWLAVGCGFSLRSGRDLVRIGEALESLPEVRASFARGELSLDKVRLLVEVATPEDEHLWADLARQLSPSQLARVCRNYRLALAAQDPAPAEDRFAAHQADALAAVFRRYGEGGEGSGGSAAQVVVHVDEAVLRGERRGGRFEIEDGPPRGPQTLR